MCIFCDLEDVSSEFAKVGEGPKTLEARLQAERCRLLKQRQISCFLFVGFLGAGKTTVLNSVLKNLEAEKKRIGVIENEAGPVSLDDKFLDVRSNSHDSFSTGIERPIIVTSGSCVCCKVRGDLVQGLLTLAEFRYEQAKLAEQYKIDGNQGLDYIFLEASGLAEVKPIIQTFYDPKVQQKVRLESVVAVVDCTNTMAENEELVKKQVLLADVVIVSKKSMVSTASYEETLHSIMTWNPAASIKVAETTNMTLSDINSPIIEHLGLVKNRLQLIRNENKSFRHISGKKKHMHESWGTVALEMHGFVHLKLLQQWLRTITFALDEKRKSKGIGNRLTIYRAKGLIRYSEGILELQIVGAHVNLTPVLNEIILKAHEPSVLVLIAPCLMQENVKGELFAGFQKCFPGFYRRLFLACQEFVGEVLMGAFVKLSSGLIDLARGRIDTVFKAKYS